MQPQQQRSTTYSQKQQQSIVCVVTSSSSLDVKEESSPVAPSYRAVAALSHADWVILTNGRLWRLYSSRISSASTNYFEVDLEGVSDDTDRRLNYFVSLFSATSLVKRSDGLTDLDSILDGGLRHAKEIEDDLRSKYLLGKLFLNLVKAILSFSSDKKYSQAERDEA